MLVFLILSLEINISPNPIEGKVGEIIPFAVRVLDGEGAILKGKINFSVIPNSLGRIQDNTFVANQEGRGVLKCISRINGRNITGFAYIKIGGREKAKIFPSVSILGGREKVKFTIRGGEAKEWKCVPSNIGNISNGVFTAQNTGRGRVIAVLTNGEIITAFIRVRGFINDIKVTPKFKRLKIGETVQFKTEEKQKVIWSVEEEKIGTISSNGLFTAKMPGKATIKAKGERNEGQAIVIVRGEVGLRIIPETATLQPGEKTKFKVVSEGFGNVSLPITWKTVPEKCGIIRKDGTFIAGKVPTKGRVIALLPKRFGQGIVSADIYVTSDKIEPLKLIPAFKHFLPEDIDKSFHFSVLGMPNSNLQWRIIPEDLGLIDNNGAFIPKRLGAGVVIAEPKAKINVRPARAFIVVGEDSYANLTADTSSYATTDGERFTPPAHIDFSFPGLQVIEGLKIPLRLEKEPEDYLVKWKVVPASAGRIISNREFHANMLPEDIDHINVKIFAFLHRGRQIVAWTSKRITVVKNP